MTDNTTATAAFTKFPPIRTTLAKACASIRMHVLTKPDAKAYLRDVATERIIAFDRYSPAPPTAKPGAEEHEVDLVLTRAPGEVRSPTEKQIAFIASLRTQTASHYPMGYEGAQMAAAKVAEAALALSLPEPRTMAEAGIMIDSLQRDIREYARWRPVWSQPILDRLAVKLGEHGEHAQVRQPDGAEWTWLPWKAYVESLLQD